MTKAATRVTKAMMTSTKPTAGETRAARRTADLRHLLTKGRREMRDEVESRVRVGRTDRPADGRDDLEHSEADTQGDIALALLQMKTETLTRIDAALVRLDAGKYGSCIECEDEIAERRLRALPFAVRCQACEQQREQELGRVRRLAAGPGRLAAYSDSVRT